MAQVAVAISGEGAVARRAVSPNVLRTSALQAQFTELQQQWQELKENRPASRARSRPLSRQSPDLQSDINQIPTPTHQPLQPSAATAQPASVPDKLAKPAADKAPAKFSTPQAKKKKPFSSRPPWDDKFSEEQVVAEVVQPPQQQAPHQQGAQQKPPDSMPATAPTSLTLTIITPSSADPVTTPVLRGSAARGIASLSGLARSSGPAPLSPASPGAQPLTISGDMSPAASISDVSSLTSPSGPSGLPGSLDSPGTAGARSPHSRIPVPAADARSTSVPRGGHSRIPSLAQSGGGSGGHVPRNSVQSVQASSEMPLDNSSSFDISSLGASASTLPSPAGQGAGHNSGARHHRGQPAATRRGPSPGVLRPRWSEDNTSQASVSTSSVPGGGGAQGSPQQKGGRLSPQPPSCDPPAAGGAQIRRRSSTQGTPPGSAKPTPPPSPGRAGAPPASRSPRAEAAVAKDSGAAVSPVSAGPVRPTLHARLAAHRRSKSGGGILAQAKEEAAAAQSEVASNNPLAALAAAAVQQGGSGKQHDASYMRKLSALKRPPPHATEHVAGSSAPHAEGCAASISQGQVEQQQQQKQRPRWGHGPSAAVPQVPEEEEGQHQVPGLGLAVEASAGGDSCLLSSSLSGPAAVKAAALGAGMTPAKAALAALASTRPGSRGRPMTPARATTNNTGPARTGVSRAARERVSSPVVLGGSDSGDHHHHDHISAGVQSSGEGLHVPPPTAQQSEAGRVVSELLVVDHPPADNAPGADQHQQEQQPQGPKRKQLTALARQRSLVVQQAVALGDSEASSGGQQQQQQTSREAVVAHEQHVTSRGPGPAAIPEANLIVPDNSPHGMGHGGSHPYPLHHHPHLQQLPAGYQMQGPEAGDQQPNGVGYGSGRQRARWQIPDGPQPHVTHQQGPGHRWGGAGPPPAMYAPMALPHAMGPPEMLPSWAAPGHQSGAQVQGKPVSAGPYRAPAHPYAPADLAASHPGPQHLQRSNSDRMYAPGPGQQMPWAPAPHVPPQQPGLFPGNAYGHVSGPMMPPGLQQAPVYPASHQPRQAHSPPPYQQPAWHQGLTAAYSPGAGPSTGNMRPPYGMHQQGYGQAPPVGGPEFGSRRLQGPGVQPWAQHQQPGDYAGGSGSGGGGVPEWARLNAGQYYSTGWSAAPHEAAAGPLSGFADVLRHRAMQQQQQHGYAGPPGHLPQGPAGGLHPPLHAPPQGPLGGPGRPAGFTSQTELAAERRQAQNTFEGLSLAEVLASAPRKEPPFPRKKLDVMDLMGQGVINQRQ